MFKKNRSIRTPLQPLRQLASALTLLGAATAILGGSPANAVSLELKGAAPAIRDRHQSSPGTDLPMPKSPSVAKLDERLAEKRLTRGSPVLLRVFKEEAELELWMQQDVRFVHFATYPICDWSGGLGPKLLEGDKQSPEGFYTITRERLHRSTKWPHSFDLGFPNVLDRSLLRTGSYLLIHGGCSSTGCFAMTDAVMAQIHELVSGAVEAGQEHVPVHVFPFRMSAANIGRHSKSAWYDFWANLKEGYDAFERTRLPPRISVCNGRYQIADARAVEASAPSQLTACAGTTAILEAEEELRDIVREPSLWDELPEADRKLLALLPMPIEKIAAQLATAKVAYSKSRKSRSATAAASGLKCNLGLASCRRFLALKQRRMKSERANAAKRKGSIATAQTRGKNK